MVGCYLHCQIEMKVCGRYEQSENNALTMGKSVREVTIGQLMAAEAMLAAAQGDDQFGQEPSLFGSPR